MLPEIELDDERFEDIVKKAVTMIPGAASQWTDHNYHDPGITMLELLAWMKEMQQFHMDQIGPEHIKQYMALLGERQRHIVPATAFVTVAPLDEPQVVPGGSRFWASDIPFETVGRRYLEGVRIVRLRTVDAEYRVGDGRLHIPIFGSPPQAGASFDVGFSEPLAKKREHKIYFRMFHGYPVERNAIDADFIPLASVAVEYPHDGTFTQVERLDGDETHQFLQDGFVTFRISQDMEPDGDGIYWLRFRLVEEQYDVAPTLDGISFHALELRQRRTLCEYRLFKWQSGEKVMMETGSYLGGLGGWEVYIDSGTALRRYDGEVRRELVNGRGRFTMPDMDTETAGSGLVVSFEEGLGDTRLLGIGDGFPSQVFDVDIDGLCAEGLELIIETEEGSGVFERWNRVESFGGCAPSDRAYIFDEENGELTFGDSVRGLAPNGRILMIAGQTSLGAKGNVKAGTIRRFERDGCFSSIRNLEDASGGENHESLEACRIRANRKLQAVERAVTYEDYEVLTSRTSGLMIEKVRAIPASERPRQDGTLDENVVALVVKPYSDRPRGRPNRAYIENIMNMLEPRRLIGTRITVLPPEYIGITVFAEIETDSDRAPVKRDIAEALERYFERQENVFGKMVSYGEIYGIIDGIEHVAAVKLLSLDAKGSKIRRSRNGDILIPANGLAYLDEWDCLISSAG